MVKPHFDGQMPMSSPCLPFLLCFGTARRLDGKGAGLEAKGFPTWPILGMENHGGTNGKNREASDIYKYCTIYV